MTITTATINPFAGSRQFLSHFQCCASRSESSLLKKIKIIIEIQATSLKLLIIYRNNSVIVASIILYNANYITFISCMSGAAKGLILLHYATIISISTPIAKQLLLLQGNRETR